MEFDAIPPIQESAVLEFVKKYVRAVVERIYKETCEARDKRTRNSDIPPWEEFSKR